MSADFDPTTPPTKEDLEALSDEDLASLAATYCNDDLYLPIHEVLYAGELERRLHARELSHLVSMAKGELFRNENSLLPVFADLAGVPIPELPRILSEEELLTQRHAELLASQGIPNKGLRPHTGFRRVTHCYRCRRSLTTDFDLACNGCGWLVCICGACGCGWNR